MEIIYKNLKYSVDVIHFVKKSFKTDTISLSFKIPKSMTRDFIDMFDMNVCHVTK